MPHHTEVSLLPLMQTHTLSSDVPLLNFDEDSETEDGDLEEEIEGLELNISSNYRLLSSL